MYTIEKGIEFNFKIFEKNINNKYPWSKMEFGDSFLVPFEDTSYKAIHASVSRANFRFGSRVFFLVRESNGFRVFKVNGRQGIK